MLQQRGRWSSVWAVVAGILAVGGAARALTDEELFRDFRFNLVNPGGRAQGLGGAFTAIADDATAALANPAGLYALNSAEFSGELRSLNNDTEVFTSSLGSLDVDPVTAARDLPFLGLTSVSEPDTITEPTFIGLAFPFRLGSKGRRLTLSESRHVVLNQDRRLGSASEQSRASFSFATFPNTVSGDTVRAYAVDTPVSGGGEMKIVYWSVGVGLEVHPDFSVGGTLSYATLDIEASTSTQILDPLELFLDPMHPRLPATPTSDVYRTAIDDTDDGFAYAVGIHWHPDTVFARGDSPWRVGAVFRKGAEFTVMEAARLNETMLEVFENTIVVPDRYTLGVSYRTPTRWLFVLEAERVEYSDMLQGFRSGVNFLTSGRVADGAFGTDPEASVEFTVEDATIPRAGVEYSFPSSGSLAVAVQGGYYRQPSSRIHMQRFNSTDPDVNEVYLQAFREGEAVHHATIGVGLRYGRSRLQAAADLSDEGSQVVGSYTFTWAARSKRGEP